MAATYIMTPETNPVDTGMQHKWHPVHCNLKAKRVVPTSMILSKKFGYLLVDNIRTARSLVIADSWPDFQKKNLEMKCRIIVLRWEHYHEQRVVKF
jgi:hypothetical protein